MYAFIHSFIHVILQSSGKGTYRITLRDYHENSKANPLRGAQEVGPASTPSLCSNQVHTQQSLFPSVQRLRSFEFLTNVFLNERCGDGDISSCSGPSSDSEDIELSSRRLYSSHNGRSRLWRCLIRLGHILPGSPYWLGTADWGRLSWAGIGIHGTIGDHTIR